MQISPTRLCSTKWKGCTWTERHLCRPERHPWSIFLHQLFRENRQVRFQAILFPVHRAQRGSGYQPCLMRVVQAAGPVKNTGWLEILGSGMGAPQGFGESELRPPKVGGSCLRHGKWSGSPCSFTGIDDIRACFSKTTSAFSKSSFRRGKDASTA